MNAFGYARPGVLDTVDYYLSDLRNSEQVRRARISGVSLDQLHNDLTFRAARRCLLQTFPDGRVR
jgi:hypothetical protein